jgi:hypothetical protein
MWELMITHQWGRVHGIFYPDGTVRDPSIVAAVLGFFRNRSREVLPEVPDAEGRVTQAMAENKKWLADPNPNWEEGLDMAERTANLLEAGQLIAMHDPPTRIVDLLRGGRGGPNVTALRSYLQKWTELLEAWQLPVGDSQRVRDFGWIR